MNFTAFISYVLISCLTPGPNNIMAMTNAGRYGFKGALPFNSGVVLGIIILDFCCAVFSSLLFDYIPSIEPFMRCLGAAYILWLAWKVWRDRSAGDKHAVMKTNTFFSGIILQFVNVKAIFCGLTVMSSFVLPYYRQFWQIMGFVGILAIGCLLGVTCWALFGSAFERLFKTHGRIINTVMALLLVYCALSMVWGMWA